MGVRGAPGGGRRGPFRVLGVLVTSLTLSAWLVLTAIPASAANSCTVTNVFGVVEVTYQVDGSDATADKNPDITRTAAGVIQIDGAALPGGPA